MHRVKTVLYVAICLFAAACGSSGSNPAGGSTPTAPTPPANPPRLTAPRPESPTSQIQLSTLRPTLTVENGTSDQSGTRTYEFQISDRADFSALANTSAGATRSLAAFLIAVSRTGIAEGDGRTSFGLDEDLQPATRYYWRARMTQSATSSDWSEARSFKTKLVGYSRPGELYDPLIHGETIGTRIGSTTFIDGQGIRIDNANSYVRYQLRKR